MLGPNADKLLEMEKKLDQMLDDCFNYSQEFSGGDVPKFLTENFHNMIKSASLLANWCHLQRLSCLKTRGETNVIQSS